MIIVRRCLKHKATDIFGQVRRVNRDENKKTKYKAMSTFLVAMLGEIKKSSALFKPFVDRQYLIQTLGMKVLNQGWETFLLLEDNLF